jgi:hypothetical protein
MIRAAVLEPTLSLPEGGSELLPLFVVSGARGRATQNRTVLHLDTGRPFLDFILRFHRFLLALLGHGGGPVAR